MTNTNKQFETASRNEKRSKKKCLRYNNRLRWLWLWNMKILTKTLIGALVYNTQIFKVE